ncbi:MAG: hypothetical protein O7G87_01390, partial [bacterium]|nr:hypothetical protein [bacterium]
MSDLDHAHSLLAMAQKDLTALEGMQDAQTFASEIFGFHAQQAVEKALKPFRNGCSGFLLPCGIECWRAY